MVELINSWKETAQFAHLLFAVDEDDKDLEEYKRQFIANAVVGIKKINAHYDQAGSQWRVSRVAYCGTAVVSAN